MAKTKASKNERKCVLILGMHRSGTSAFAGTLEKVGLNLGDNLMPGNAYNKKGYYEDIDFYNLNDRILNSYGRNWDSIYKVDIKSNDLFKKEIQNLYLKKFGEMGISVIKDPRISLFFPLWKEALDEINVKCYAVIAIRNPLEVAESLEKRDQFSLIKSLMLWASHSIQAEIHTREIVPRMFVHYEEFIVSPKKYIEKLFVLIGSTIQLSNALLDDITIFLDPALKHNNANKDIDIKELPWIKGLYSELQKPITNSVLIDENQKLLEDKIDFYYTSDVAKTLSRDLNFPQTSLYINTGYGFEEKTRQRTNTNHFNGEFKIVFDSLNKYGIIKAVRWDPIEDEFIKIIISSIKYVDAYDKFVEVNYDELKTNGIRVAEGTYEFHTTDPWIEFNVNSELAKIHLIGRIWKLDTRNIFRLNKQEQQKLIKTIDALQKEKNIWFNTTNNILTKKNSLIDDLTKIKNSSVNELAQIKISSANELAQIKISSANELAQIKISSANELIQIKASSSQEVEQIKASSLKEVEQIKASSLKEVEQIKASSLKEVEQLKTELINVTNQLADSNLKNEELIKLKDAVLSLKNINNEQSVKINALSNDYKILSDKIIKTENSLNNEKRISNELKKLNDNNKGKVNELQRKIEIKNIIINESGALINYFKDFLNQFPSILFNKWFKSIPIRIGRLVKSKPLSISTYLLDPLVFNPSYYLECNETLRDNLNNDINLAIKHWIEYGSKEGLPSSSVFHVKYYLEKNKDVKQFFNNDYRQAIRHWVERGVNEGRNGSPEFDVNSYANRYSDVRRATGNDFKLTVLHWLNHGKWEGRKGIPESKDTEIKITISDPINSTKTVEKTNALKKVDSSPLIIYESHNLNLQGAPNSLFEIASGINSLNNYNVMMMAPSEGPLAQSYSNSGIPYVTHSISQRRLGAEGGPYKYIDELAKIYKKTGARIIHVNTLQNYHSILAAHSVGIPTIWNIRESENPETYYDYLTDDLKKLAYSAFDRTSAVVFVAEATRQIWLPLIKNKVKSLTISNGVKNERLMKFVYGTNREAIRANYGVSNEDVIIYNVGTVSERKGQKDLVDSIKLLDASIRKKIVVAIAGFNDGDYSIEIERQLNELHENLGCRLIMIKESSSINERREVAELYLASDIFVLTSRIESYPRVILEAMEFKLAIISTPCFGVKEQLVDLESVLFYEEEDTNKLSEHIQSLVNDSEKRRTLGKEAKRRLLDLNSYPQMLELYQSLYNHVLNSDADQFSKVN